MVSSFIFPRTESVASSLTDAACKIVLRQEDGLNWDVVRQGIQSDVELLAFSGIEDLLAFIEVIEPYAKEINLHLMDHLIIYRGGIDLLVVTLPGNKRGRCAYVELNDCRRRLHSVAAMVKAVSDKHQGEIAYLFFTVALCTGAAIIASLATSRWNKDR